MAVLCLLKRSRLRLAVKRNAGPQDVHRLEAHATFDAR